MANAKDELIGAIDAAAAGHWDEAHAIAQRHEGDPIADWLHAVLHKIEGDADNSRYWYRRTSHTFEEFTDPQAEISAIRAAAGSAR
jgi:hypothetical protein